MTVHYPDYDGIKLQYMNYERDGQRAEVRYSLIVTVKMNDIDPQARLADVLARIAAHPAHRLDELLPWNWTPKASVIAAVAA